MASVAQPTPKATSDSQTTQQFTVGEPFNPYRKTCGFSVRDAVKAMPSLKPSEKLAYIHLVDVAGKKAVCWPSQHALGEALGYGQRWASAAIHALKTEGLIGAKRRRGSSVYCFLYHSWFDTWRGRQAEKSEGEKGPLQGDSEDLRYADSVRIFEGERDARIGTDDTHESAPMIRTNGVTPDDMIRTLSAHRIVHKEESFINTESAAAVSRLPHARERIEHSPPLASVSVSENEEQPEPQHLADVWPSESDIRTVQEKLFAAVFHELALGWKRIRPDMGIASRFARRFSSREICLWWIGQYAAAIGARGRGWALIDHAAMEQSPEIEAAYQAHLEQAEADAAPSGSNYPEWLPGVHPSHPETFKRRLAAQQECRERGWRQYAFDCLSCFGFGRLLPDGGYCQCRNGATAERGDTRCPSCGHSGTVPIDSPDSPTVWSWCECRHAERRRAAEPGLVDRLSADAARLWKSCPGKQPPEGKPATKAATFSGSHPRTRNQKTEAGDYRLPATEGGTQCQRPNVS